VEAMAGCCSRWGADGCFVGVDGAGVSCSARMAADEAARDGVLGLDAAGEEGVLPSAWARSPRCR
jgi:hypothetical protein